MRYPLVEATTSVLFLLVFWTMGWSWFTPGYWLLLSWLLALSLIDLDTMTLPNSLTQSGLVVGLGFQLFMGWATTASLAGTINQLMVGIGGAVLGMWVLDGITLVGTLVMGQTAMGGGDAKLTAMIGAWLGWQQVLLTGFLGCAMGAFVGGAAIALKLVSRRQPIPFGPFLALGAGLAALFGQHMITAYISWFFPPL
jgi:leader peptidase (prepilin peptidase)/N-methyltransferase